MKTLGRATAALAAAVAGIAVVVGVQSVSDVRRYLKIRSM